MNHQTDSARCLTVIIPVYNEADTIETLLERVLAQPAVREVLVVDDASADGTRDKLLPWPARDSRIRLFHHAANRGKGAAIRTALPAVTSPWVLIQDADLEYDPQDYETLLEPARNGLAEVVYGSRFAGPGWRQSLKLHTLQNRLLTAVSNFASGLRLSDSATCYKLFRSDLLKALTLKEDRFGFCPEVTAKLARAGVRIQEVPVRYRGRTHAAGKKLRFRDGLSALRCILVYNCRP